MNFIGIKDTLTLPIYVGVLNKLSTALLPLKQLTNYKNIIHLLIMSYNPKIDGHFHIYINNVEMSCILNGSHGAIKINESLEIPENMFVNSVSINARLLKTLNDKCVDESMKQIIRQQITNCNHLLQILNTYRECRKGPHTILASLPHIVTTVAINTTINWSTVCIFKKIDEFVIHKKLSPDKHHNQLYYISIGSPAGVFYDNKTHTYIMTSCLGIFINHSKHTYHAYPVLDTFKSDEIFKTHQLPIRSQTIDFPQYSSEIYCVYDWDESTPFFTQ
jgi:hypothetical protein